MTKREFYRMPTRRKWLYILCKIGIMLTVIAMGIIAVFASGLELPTVESQLSFSVGIVMIALVTVFALTNRLKTLIKIKSLSFVVIFVLLLAFSYTMHYLIYAVGLISIPLLIDDMIVTPIWTNYVANTQDTQEVVQGE